MSINDFLYTFEWWFILFIFGVASLPISRKIFPLFINRGYAFSKVLGIAVGTYSIFILGVLHIIPFNQYTAISAIVLWAIINWLILKKDNKNEFLHDIKSKAFIFTALLEELFVFLGLLYWSYVRAHQPDIHGLEKYMDYGFINSILRSTYFPPHDMWLTPLFINYYYFGHLTTAVLTKISAIPSYITFNLMVATIFALCLSCSFSLMLNILYFLKKQLSNNPFINRRTWTQLGIGAFVSAFLVTLGGNAHTIYSFFRAYPNDTPVPPWQLDFLPLSFPNNYWYPNATRFIYHTIHEFPAYSFVVSDLHGHVLDIPFVLLTIAAFFSLLLKYKTADPEIKNKKQKKVNGKLINMLYSFSAQAESVFGLKTQDMVALSFLIAIMYMTNAWDGLIYLVFSGLFFTYLVFAFDKNETFTIKILSIFKKMLVIFVGCLIFCLPFSIFFKPFANQVGIVCPPDFLVRVGKIGPLVFEANHCMQSPAWQLLILYGFFYFWIFAFLIFLAIKGRKVAVATATDVFIFLLIICGTLLIIAPEFVYLRDIYTTYFRANTMFKMVYQAFIMLSLASGYIVFRIAEGLKNQGKNYLGNIVYSGYLILSALAITIVAIYPYFAINSYYDNLTNYKGLNGLTYLSSLYPTDSQAIDWLNKNIKGQPVILEAQGDSYTDYARVSANTGLPTVLGWTVHEWLWRDTYDVAPPRINDIQMLYETLDVPVAQSIISKYNISLIFIGDLERKKYKVSEEKFRQLGKVIFSSGNTTVYRLN